ncbi:MAG: hypothetical protein K9M81_05425 [Chthoniobacterales bacterium]|nr:hypothetical protein [Chthoniobacterales bacterium]
MPESFPLNLLRRLGSLCECCVELEVLLRQYVHTQPSSDFIARLVLISFARHLMTIQYEISGLTRIFHTNLLRRPGSQMDAALDSHFDLGSMYTYSPASNCSAALPHPPSQPPRHDQYEISGLTHRF